MRGWINASGQHTMCGSFVLARGAPRITLGYGGPYLHAGKGRQFRFGLLVLARDDDDPVSIIPAAQVRPPCGRRLARIEALEVA